MGLFIEIRPGSWRRLADVHRAVRLDDGTVELRFVDSETVTVDEKAWLAAIDAAPAKPRTRKAA